MWGKDELLRSWNICMGQVHAACSSEIKENEMLVKLSLFPLDLMFKWLPFDWLLMILRGSFAFLIAWVPREGSYKWKFGHIFKQSVTAERFPELSG